MVRSGLLMIGAFGRKVFSGIKRKWRSGLEAHGPHMSKIQKKNLFDMRTWGAGFEQLNINIEFNPVL